MPCIQIKDVPADVHAVLRDRAAAAHQSLQEYLLSQLIAQARRPTLDEVLDEAARNARVSLTFEEAAALVREDRDRH
jgi:hypothetical protein